MAQSTLHHATGPATRSCHAHSAPHFIGIRVPSDHETEDLPIPVAAAGTQLVLQHSQGTEHITCGDKRDLGAVARLRLVVAPGWPSMGL